MLQLSLDTGLGWYYQHQADNLNAQAMSVYRQAFPDDRRTHPGNVRRVVEGQLRQNADSGPSLNFITLMKLPASSMRRFLAAMVFALIR
ncbi:GspL/Epsl periplasmic domain-containing protein [Marinobacter gelidimuriae]|uniref:GspL/Epsl periplasmic domain-containing protein n=1 Tax=Marinobacter gelidimuriae TaxID=2739064 RepID=UPI0003A9AA64|nr:GspL/Epsl periplasmic domain-containing protein [Marinobacter gelidimuriae]